MLSARKAFLLILGALLSVAAMASGQTRARYVQPAGLENNPRYSHAVVVEPGRMVYVSGQVARDSAGKTVGAGDMRAQAKQVFENLKIALEAAGSDLAHVVKLNSYLTGHGPDGRLPRRSRRIHRHPRAPADEHHHRRVATRRSGTSPRSRGHRRSPRRALQVQEEMTRERASAPLLVILRKAKRPKDLLD